MHLLSVFGLPFFRRGGGGGLDGFFGIGGGVPTQAIEEVESLGGLVKPFLIAGGIAEQAGGNGAQQGGSIGIVDLFPNGETGKEGSMFAGARSRLCIQRGCLLLVYRPQKQNATETRRILGG